MGDTTHPHDKYFKTLLDQPGVARALLTERLPASIVALFAPEDPERIPGSFIDEDLRESTADALFRVKTTRPGPGEAFIYCLEEHKSYPDRRVALQLLGYLARVWSFLDKDRPADEPLPLVIPLVVYTGERPWNVPREFADLLAVDESLRPLALNFRYQLLNLPAEPLDERLSSNSTLRTALVVMRTVWGGEVTLRSAFVAAGELPDGGFLLQTLTYILSTSDADGDLAMQTMREVMPNRTEAVKSVADQLEARGWVKGREEGRQEGLQEGRQEGLQEARTTLADLLRHQLEHKFGEVPDRLDARIVEADMGLLARWTKRAMDATCLDDVFAD